MKTNDICNHCCGHGACTKAFILVEAGLFMFNKSMLIVFKYLQNASQIGEILKLLKYQG
jgi:hypothetical protein